MHEQFKLDQAEYFLGRMARLQDKKKEFHFNLDAFLAAARSVMQFAGREARHTQDGEQWYNSLFEQYETLRFFRDQRNIIIHERPLTPKRRAEVAACEVLTVSITNLSIELLRVDEVGNVVEHVESRKASEPESEIEQRTPDSQSSGASVDYEFKFADWDGPENVIDLSVKHLDELAAMIEDGVSRGILTPSS